MRGIGRFHRLLNLGRFVSRPPLNGPRPHPLLLAFSYGINDFYRAGF